MPNRSAAESNLEFFVNDAGEWRTTGVIHTADLQGEDVGVRYHNPSAEDSVSFKIDLPHCPSRKRFVKLLMAERTSRNDAEAAARIVREYGYSYRYGLFWWRVAGSISIPTIFASVAACGGF